MFCSLQTAQSLVSSEFAKNESIKAAEYDLTAMTNATLIRYLEKILDVGISGYSDTAVLERVILFYCNILNPT